MDTGTSSIVDYATTYSEAITLKAIIKCLAEALLSVLSLVGMSDPGSQFTSGVMKEFHRLLSMNNINTTPYHVMCKGLVERFNSVEKNVKTYV